MATNVSAGTDGNSLFLMHLAHVVMKFSLRNRARAIREFIALIRLMRDFVCGFRVLHFVGSCVTVFGKMKNSPVVIMGTDTGTKYFRSSTKWRKPE